VSVIGGFWDLSGNREPERACRRLLEAQKRYGRHGESLLHRGEIAIGRSLYRLLPEDQHDRQPLVGGDGRLLLVADIRIDNREELLSRLGSRQGPSADAQLLLRAWERWGEKCLDWLVGDFAFAVWDRQERRLSLVRDPTGQRPLHYHSGRGFFAFASMPRALQALDEVPTGVDEQRMAELIADMWLPQGATYYKGISRVPSGHAVTVGPGGIELRRYWDPPLRQLRLPSDQAYVDAFREQIDRATAARLRRAGGGVASHLSSGYDSGTVTATAARLMAPSGERLLAFTSAPRKGYQGPMQRGRIADESGLAATVAALHPNIEHIIMRPDGTSPLELIDRTHAASQCPMGQPSNNVWWSAINDEAQRRGAGVLLIGHAGNVTLNAGGLGLLADLVRERRWLAWAREARQTVAKGPARLTGVLVNSFGPWTPRFVAAAIDRIFLKASRHAHVPHMLSPQWAEQIDNGDRPGRDGRRPKDSYRIRKALLQRFDPGYFRKASLARWGIDERDPMADRRVIEFSLSLPPDQLYRDGVSRPLARRALADRLPPAILDNRLRGYQAAEWHSTLTKDALRHEVELVESSPGASAILNVRRLKEMVEQWPQDDQNSLRVVQEYRLGLLVALSAAHFIRAAEAPEEAAPAPSQ
jgi:asparagine synthase (glutamine-hydrolysing)